MVNNRFEPNVFDRNEIRQVASTLALKTDTVGVKSPSSSTKHTIFDKIKE